jgi:hypothetical protein
MSQPVHAQLPLRETSGLLEPYRVSQPVHAQLPLRVTQKNLSSSMESLNPCTHSYPCGCRSARRRFAEPPSQPVHAQLPLRAKQKGCSMRTIGLNPCMHSYPCGSTSLETSRIAASRRENLQPKPIFSFVHDFRHRLQITKQSADFGLQRYQF